MKSMQAVDICNAIIIRRRPRTDTEISAFFRASIYINLTILRCSLWCLISHRQLSKTLTHAAFPGPKSRSQAGILDTQNCGHFFISALFGTAGDRAGLTEIGYKSNSLWLMDSYIYSCRYIFMEVALKASLLTLSLWHFFFSGIQIRERNMRVLPR